MYLVQLTAHYALSKLHFLECAHLANHPLASSEMQKV